MLSNTCKYGLRAVIYLAVNEKKGAKIGIKVISKELGIPTPFLGKILQSLSKQKILSSTKGPHGGFGLGIPAEKISILDVVIAIDGPDVLDSCLIDLKTCRDVAKDGQPCPLHERYAPIRSQTRELFRNLNIAQLVQDVNKFPEIRI